VLGNYEAEGSQYTILGNSLVSDALSDSGVTLLNGISPNLTEDETEGDTEDESGAEEDAEGYQEISENTGEIENKESTEQVLAQAAEIANAYQELEGSLLFDNVINEAEIDSYLTAGKATFTTDSGLTAVVSTSDIKTSTCGDKVRLIITTGDVTIDTSKFQGLIIAKGKITIGVSASSIKLDKMGLYKVLSATSGVEGDTETPIDFFAGGGGSLSEGAETAKTDDAGNLNIDYSDVVRYVNWIKK
jgi:hypothetical protein